MLVHCSISACLRSCAAARSGTTISGKARDRSAGKPPPIFRAARGGALSGRLDVGARFGGDSAATSAFTICSTSNCEAAAASGAKPIVCALVVSDFCLPGVQREYSTNPRLTASDVLLAVYTQGSTGVLGRYWGAQIPFLLVPRMITVWAEHGIREHGFRE